MKKVLVIVAAFFIVTTAAAQQPAQSDLSYSYAELRFVDVDVSGGDGLKVAGSYELNGPWILVGALTSLDFNNNVDSTLLELGGGYVWKYNRDFDFFSTLRLVRASVDTPGGDADDNGFAFSAGTRGYLTPQFEVRGSVNHINLDNSDTFLELGGDYYFTRQFAAGVTLDVGGDVDTFTLGARWFFR